MEPPGNWLYRETSSVTDVKVTDCYKTCFFFVKNRLHSINSTTQVFYSCIHQTPYFNLFIVTFNVCEICFHLCYSSYKHRSLTRPFFLVFFF